MNSHRIQPRIDRVEKSKTRAVIFDIGRVIVRLEPKRALAIFNDGIAKKKTPSRNDAAIDADQIWLAIQNDPMWHDWQEGRASARVWHANVCKRFGLKVGFEDFLPGLEQRDAA